MESWNVGRPGMVSGKRSILQKMLNLHFMMMPVRHPFSAFAPLATHYYEKIKPIIFVMILQTHHSIIPEPMIPIFQNSIIPIGAKPLSSYILLPIFFAKSGHHVPGTFRAIAGGYIQIGFFVDISFDVNPFAGAGFFA